MEYIGQTLCATYAELTCPEMGIMTVRQLRHSRDKGETQQLQKGGRGRIALFAVDSLPLKFKNEVYRRNPDLQRTARAVPFTETVQMIDEVEKELNITDVDHEEVGS